MPTKVVETRDRRVPRPQKLRAIYLAFLAIHWPARNPQQYPHLLALAGLTDPRVTYWEPAKWVAKLREYDTSDNLTLLKTNMDAGHGGASGRFEALKEVAMEYAFALKVANRLTT